MYQKFWNQFLIEVAQPTFDLGPDTIPDDNAPKRRQSPNPFTTGIGAYLISKGYDLDTKLGGGMDGTVYRAINKKTGKNVAVKVVPYTTRGDMDREVANYKFILDNRQVLGEFAKYFPVVFSSEVDEIPAQRETMEGRKIEAGVIIMEELEPLPDDIARSLFASNVDYDKDKRAREQRDKRLFRNPKLVANLISMAISLSDPASTRPYITIEAEDEARKKIIKRLFGSERSPIALISKPMRPRGALGMTSRGLEVMSLFVRTMYKEMVKDQESKEDLHLVRDYKAFIRRNLAQAFLNAYSRPVVSGAAADAMKDSSSLRGIDQYYSAEDDVAAEFPESVGIRKAMQALSGEGLKPFDVHNANVMMRPKTKDIVIVDLGRFKGLESIREQNVVSV